MPRGGSIKNAAPSAGASARTYLKQEYVFCNIFRKDYQNGQVFCRFHTAVCRKNEETVRGKKKREIENCDTRA